MFEVLGEVESGRFGDFRREFEVVGLGQFAWVDYARNCGRSGQGWNSAVTDDVVLEDASRRLGRRLIPGWDLRGRLLGLLLLKKLL